MPRIKFILASVVAVVVDTLQMLEFFTIANVKSVFLESIVLKKEQRRLILAFNVVLVHFRRKLEQIRLIFVMIAVLVDILQKKD